MFLAFETDCTNGEKQNPGLCHIGGRPGFPAWLKTISFEEDDHSESSLTPEKHRTQTEILFYFYQWMAGQRNTL